MTIQSLFHLYTAIALRAHRKMLRRPVTLMFSLVQPLVWMMFFGFLMQRYPLIDLPAGVDYLSFLVPGVCGMTVLFGASQAGIPLIHDLQTGFLQRMLSTPVPRWVLHTGKITADGLRLIVQAAFVAGLGLILGASLKVALLPLITAIFSFFLFATGLGSLSCAIAVRARRQETMATFVHLINMPMFFTSTALVPHRQMPEWLASLAVWNPLTLAVESLRSALLFQTMPPVTTHLLPLAGFSFCLIAFAIVTLKRGAVISSWEVR